MEAFASIVSTISGYLYSYILIALLIGAGIYFTIRTKFVQFRLLGESIRVIKEPKKRRKSNFFFPGSDGFYCISCRYR